ncbi:MAG: type IV secretion system protein [Lautropia sp.]
MAAPQQLGAEFVTMMNGFTNNFVMPRAQNLLEGIAPILTSALAIYLFFRGWSLIRGTSNETFPGLTRDAFRISFILAIGFAIGNYMNYVVDTLFALRDWLVGVMMDGRDFATIINAFWTAARDFASANFQTGWFAPIAFTGATMAAILTMLAAGVLLIVALGYYALCQVALTLLAAFGPLFVLCAMFEPTKRFTEGWLSQMLNYIMLSALSVAATMMAISFGTTHITRMLATPDRNLVFSVIAFDVLILTVVVLMFNLANIATALTGGIGLQGASRLIVQGGLHAYRTATAIGRETARAGGGSIGSSGPPARMAEGSGSARSPGYIYQQAARLGRNR